MNTKHIARRGGQHTSTSPKPFTGKVSTTAPVSEAQRNFIAKLIGERNLEGYDKAEAAKKVAAGELTVAKNSASQCIAELLALPKVEAVATKEANPVAFVKVPEGRYAVEMDGTLKFYVVDCPTEGRWAGYVFVKVQASDDLHPIKNRDAKAAILAAIAVDPQAASKRYGHELGCCGVCGRTLTDENSRAAGIGPICAGKMGW